MVQYLDIIRFQGIEILPKITKPKSWTDDVSDKVVHACILCEA